MSFITPEEYEALLNVTPDSLAQLAGLASEDQLPDEARSLRIKQQLGLVQSKPRLEQSKLYEGFAAKYIPPLVIKYRENSGALNSSLTLLNVIVHTPYFVRFLQSPAGQGLAALQVKRTVEAPGGDFNVETVGEICQFMSTILLLQGTADVEEAHKAILIPKLDVWRSTYRGRLASETSDRCLKVLSGDQSLEPVKKMLLSGLHTCGAKDCTRQAQADGSKLLACSRCKTAVYCGTEHQKQAWPSHKGACFPVTF